MLDESLASKNVCKNDDIPSISHQPPQGCDAGFSLDSAVKNDVACVRDSKNGVGGSGFSSAARDNADCLRFDSYPKQNVGGISSDSLSKQNDRGRSSDSLLKQNDGDVSSDSSKHNVGGISSNALMLTLFRSRMTVV